MKPINPTDLMVEFDPAIFFSKLGRLLDELKTIEGGLFGILTALKDKSNLIQDAFPIGNDLDLNLSESDWKQILNTVSTARRRLKSWHKDCGLPQLNSALTGLIYGDASISDRIEAFTGILPGSENKKIRTLWDLGSELLHFREPGQIPLLTHWVWDSNTMTGALREFIRGNDAMSEISLDNDPETFKDARQVFVRFLSEKGYYKDLIFIIDLVLAKAYGDYVRAVSSGCGMVHAEFSTNYHPLNFDLRLLGINSTTAIINKESIN